MHNDIRGVMHKNMCINRGKLSTRDGSHKEDATDKQYVCMCVYNRPSPLQYNIIHYINATGSDRGYNIRT